jgi:site-specific recombinase XerC
VQEWIGHANIATPRIYDHRKTRLEYSPAFKVKHSQHVTQRSFDWRGDRHSPSWHSYSQVV